MLLLDIVLGANGKFIVISVLSLWRVAREFFMTLQRRESFIQCGAWQLQTVKRSNAKHHGYSFQTTRRCNSTVGMWARTSRGRFTSADRMRRIMEVWKGYAVNCRNVGTCSGQKLKGVKWSLTCGKSFLSGKRLLCWRPRTLCRRSISMSYLILCFQSRHQNFAIPLSQCVVVFPVWSFWTQMTLCRGGSI